MRRGRRSRWCSNEGAELFERHRDRRFLLDALAEEAVDPGAQRDRPVDSGVRAGDVGADLDQIASLGVGGQQ